MNYLSDSSPLVLADESAVGAVVTAGLLRLPAASVDEAISRIGDLKAKAGIASEIRIHCRVMFAPHSRKNAQFRHLNVDGLHELLLANVSAMNQLGGTWWGAHVDRSKYPKSLRLVEGEAFEVTAKHLAGMVFCAATTNMEHHGGPSYRLAFDPDPTKIDWGLVSRVQATHFARIHSQRIDLTPHQLALLEMADVVSYTLAQAVHYASRPEDRKGRRYRTLAAVMQIKSVEFAWRPEP